MINVSKNDLHFKYTYEDILDKYKKERDTWKWIVLIGCLFLQMIPYCICINLTNVFTGSEWPIWLNNNLTLVNLTLTIGTLAAAIVSPIIAKMFSTEISTKFIYSLGVIFAMIGFALLGVNCVLYNKYGSNQNNEIMYVLLLYIPTIIIRVGVMVFSGLGINNLISKWWEPEKRGLALGIAFSGGSLGNIWIQKVLQALTTEFGNNPLGYEQSNGHQWATYAILAAMGLVTGLIFVLLSCKKQLPPIDILKAKFNDNKDIINKSKSLEASPLVTQKYPPYWMLLVGFMILQMGAVHSASIGQIVRFYVLPGNNESGNIQLLQSLMGTGLTIFGVTCFISNIGGGVVNDKLGPSKSILLSLIFQVACIICLIFSIKNINLVYVYFILSGLTVYIYTSTPSFICGRLFGSGQSNNQVAILGMFTAIGFALTNSISGSLMGDVEHTSTVLDRTVNGTPLNLLIFSLSCMIVGTIIVVISTSIISHKGIKGLLEYSPTKYSKIIYFKHSLSIRFASWRILWSNNDFRKNNEKRKNKFDLKRKETEDFNSFQIYYDDIKQTFSKEKLSDDAYTILSMIFFYKIISKNKLRELSKLDIDKQIDILLKKKLIIKIEMGFESAFRLAKETRKTLNVYDKELSDKFPKIIKEDEHVVKLLQKYHTKLEWKLSKLNDKLNLLNKLEIDQNKKEKIQERANYKIDKINSKKDIILNKIENNNEWSKYKVDYQLSYNLLRLENSKNKLEIKKENKISNINKKIMSSIYISNYNKLQQIDGHVMLTNYYNDIWTKYDELISKRVSDDLERKIESLNKNISHKNNKLNKLTKLNNELN